MPTFRYSQEHPGSLQGPQLCHELQAYQGTPGQPHLLQEFRQDGTTQLHLRSRRKIQDSYGRTTSEGTRDIVPPRNSGSIRSRGEDESDTGGSIRYWVHHQLARNYYQEQNILSHDQFNAIDWRSVHSTLHELPRLFQLWASKHVLKIAGTMKYLSHQDGRSPLCPSCLVCTETCKHITRCPEVGREAAFKESTAAVEKMDGDCRHKLQRENITP